MTGDCCQLPKFVQKFRSTIKFGNDKIAKIMGHGLVRGLSKLKFKKDHLCSACAMGKNKKQSHKPKSEDTNQEKLYLLHMDLCGLMRVASINRKKYILVIVDDCYRFTWVKFLTSKDEAPDFIINFLKMIKVRLNVTVRNIRIDNGTEITEKVKSQSPQILPKKVSNFAPSMIKSMVTKSLEHAFLMKESSQPKSTYEATASLTEFELKKILYSLNRSQKDKDKDEDPFARSDRGLKKIKTSKDAKPTTGSKTKESKSGTSKTSKSQSKFFGKSIQSEEPEFEVADSDMPQDQEDNLGNDNEEPKRKVASKYHQSDSRNPVRASIQTSQGTRTNYAELEYDFEECYKALSEKLDWDNPEGVAYDKHARYGISHWRYQCKTFYGYGYLREIEVRRADNDLYTFKEGDFPRLRINDIEDMLILIVHNRLTNLSGDDVSDFAIALRMFTRSMVIQKRVEDLQLGFKSYQNKINVTKPETK
nr:ribonuclease H-like domain-containing protein [Tanacetum cinerariifolium]